MAVKDVRLGIDIGGTGIKAALVDTQTGELKTERIKYKTPQPATPYAVSTVINQLLRDFSWSQAVGCCFPAVVVDNVCYTASNIPDEWIGVRLDRYFQKHCGRSFQFANDADLAGVAELRFGSVRDTSGVIIMLTIGTGIGSAIFLNGVLVPNTELGQLYYQDSIFEHYASNQARKSHDWTYKEWATHLNEMLHHVTKLFSPKEIILGGGVSKRLSLYAPYLDVDVEIQSAKLKNTAGVIGAACLMNPYVPDTYKK